MESIIVNVQVAACLDMLLSITDGSDGDTAKTRSSLKRVQVMYISFWELETAHDAPLSRRRCKGEFDTPSSVLQTDPNGIEVACDNHMQMSNYLTQLYVCLARQASGTSSAPSMGAGSVHTKSKVT